MITMTTTPPRTYSMKEVAAAIGLSYHHIWRLCKSEKIKSEQIAHGCERRIPESEFHRLLKTRRSA